MYALLCCFAFLFLHRAIEYSVPAFRLRAIKSRVTFEPDTKGIFKADLAQFLSELSIADWFMLNNVNTATSLPLILSNLTFLNLHKVGRNLDSQNFYEGLAEIIKLHKWKREMRQRDEQNPAASISRFVEVQNVQQSV